LHPEQDPENETQRTRSPLIPPTLDKLGDLLTGALGNRQGTVSRDGKTPANLVPIRRLLANAGDLGKRLDDDDWWSRQCPPGLSSGERRRFFQLLAGKLALVRGFLDGHFSFEEALDVITRVANVVIRERLYETGQASRRRVDGRTQPE